MYGARHGLTVTGTRSHRPDSGAGEPAGVVGSRVAAGHHAVTRSALDAARRRAESGAAGRRRSFGAVCLYPARMADSSALLTTCASAGATLVAIVGGLLVSRYVSLESDRQAAQRRVNELTGRLEQARTGQADAVQALNEYDIEWALDDDKVHERLLHLSMNEAVPNPDLIAELRAIVDLDGYQDVIEPVAQRMLGDARLAFATLRDKLPRRKDQPEWEEFKLGKSFPIQYEELWEHVYDAIADAIRGAIEEEEAASRPPALGRMFGVTGGLHLPPVAMPRFASASGRPRLQNRVDQANAEVATLRAELGIAMESLNRTVSPAGLVIGLVMLTYLAVTTLVVPLLFLTPTPATLSPSESSWFLAWFLSGVLALLAYLAWDALRLVRRPGAAVTRLGGGVGTE